MNIHLFSHLEKALPAFLAVGMLCFCGCSNQTTGAGEATKPTQEPTVEPVPIDSSNTAAPTPNTVTTEGSTIEEQIVQEAPVTLANNTAQFQHGPQEIRDFLSSHCYSCHGPDKQKNDLRFDTLSFDLSDHETAIEWDDIYVAITTGEMPPKKKPQPDPEVLLATSDLLRDLLFDAAKAAHDDVSDTKLRRLNKMEYANTIRDLLGVEITNLDTIPEESIEHGFDTESESLAVSPLLLGQYLEVAQQVTDHAFVIEPQTLNAFRDGEFAYGEPPPILNVDGNFKKRVLKTKGSFVSELIPVYPKGFQATSNGRYHIKIDATMKGEIDTQTAIISIIYPEAENLGLPVQIDEFELRKGEKRSYEKEIKLEQGQSIAVKLAASISKKKNQKTDNLLLGVKYISIEGPIMSKTHRKFFGNNVEGDARYSNQLFTEFMQKAFRRPVDPLVQRKYMDLASDRYKAGATFVEACQAAFSAILCSPRFLYFHEPEEELDDYSIASRLSYFLWSSMPDQTLMNLAAQGKLKDHEVIRQQAGRMLNDPRAYRFIKRFVGQWLEINKIADTTPDPAIYPKYDKQLEADMVRESELYFQEVLRKNMSIYFLVTSNFSMLNERLAQHYGVQNVKGPSFRRVSFQPGLQRGGVITQASVLTTTANGTETSPIIRGKWILDNIMGQPPTPPPPDVDPIEPDTRGSTTIFERLEKHRKVETCRACHAKIDPFGIALENYDAVGAWRPYYGGQEVEVTDGENKERILIPKRQITNHAELANGVEIQSVQGLVQYVGENRQHFARCLTEKMLSYSTGRKINYQDREEIDRIVAEHNEIGNGLYDLILLVTTSEIFLTK